MQGFLRKGLFFIVLTVFLTACGGGGADNSATSSGGGSGTSKSSANQKIVLTGGSTIARGNWSSYFGVPIENDGVSGRESWQLVPAIDGYVVSKPDKIFILIGMNDIMNRHELVLVGDITAIINKIRILSPKTKIFIISMLPVNNAFFTTLIQSYNNDIQSLCSSKSVPFISVFNLFWDSKTIIKSNYYNGDGIHLNDDGYQVLANILRAYVLS